MIMQAVLLLYTFKETKAFYMNNFFSFSFFSPTFNKKNLVDFTPIFFFLFQPDFDVS